MNRRSDLAGRAAAILGQTAGAQSAPAEVRTSAQPDQSERAEPQHYETPQVRKSAASQPRTRPVRMTVELAPMEHRALRRWCQETAEELGVSEVAGAEVVRTLLALLADDPALAKRARAALRNTGGNRRR